MRPLRALFVCDGSATVGGGHVMRSLTLARALAARGWNSTFLADAFVGGVLDRFDRVGCERLPTADQTPDGLMAAAAGVSGFSAVIVDHFEMRATHERGFRRCAPLTAAVDDLPDRPRDVDLLIDCNQCRTSDDYAVLGAGVELLLGPAYAPVRLEFAAARRATLARRGAPAPMRRVLVALGLTDVGGITERVVRALLPHFGEASVDVVLGETAPSADAMRRLAAADPRVRLHVNVRDMAALTAEADLGVGAGGSSTWERATLGLPTISLVLAPNQRPGTLALAEAGAVFVLDADAEGFEEALIAAFRRLRDDPQARGELSRRSAALCDGRGAERTADRLTARVQSGARQ